VRITDYFPLFLTELFSQPPLRRFQTRLKEITPDLSEVENLLLITDYGFRIADCFRASLTELFSQVP
jgi:hypothetical protein